ncbi:T9SS type A sorting domain-containing protein, partial [bacterium]|nr:T9SS type A sorting domain-containing protein [bacterium]
FGPLTLTSPGGRSQDFYRTQNVPAIAPPGDYTYEVYAGIYPDIIWCSDSFPFEKLETSDGPTVSNWDNWGRCFNEAGESYLGLPTTFLLLSPAPNPFNPTTTFSYELPEAVQVSLTVYDISGRQVATLVDGYRNAGTYQTEFHAEGLASGVYLYHLNADEYQTTGKMVLLK